MPNIGLRLGKLKWIVMRRFDYSFLRSGLPDADLVNVTASLSSLRTMAQFRKEGNAKVFTELEAIAKVQSVKSSNAIEGIVTSDERVAAIVNESSAPLNHNEREIAGYRDVLNDIHNNFARLDFSQTDILNMHRLMMGMSGHSDGGRYKAVNNYVIEEDRQGNRRIRFAPVAAADVSVAMEQLELAYLSARDDADVNQLLLIPCVILDFLCIHPFRDGNGRISRLLSLLLLYKAGYDVGKYISFEQQINNNKSFYYDSLRQSSEGWHENRNSYFPFIKNFLSCLYLCYKELDKRFLVMQSKRKTKGAQIESAVLESLVPVSKAELHAVFPDISVATIESVLGRMLKGKRISKLGTTHNARYFRA